MAVFFTTKSAKGFHKGRKGKSLWNSVAFKKRLPFLFLLGKMPEAKGAVSVLKK